MTAAALLPAAGDGVVNQDAAHGLRGNGEVVGSILPLDPIQLAHLDPGVMDERGCAQGVAVTFIAQLAGGNPAKLVIDERKEIVHAPNKSCKPFFVPEGLTARRSPMVLILLNSARIRQR
jgi:hypothetical protein